VSLKKHQTTSSPCIKRCVCWEFLDKPSGDAPVLPHLRRHEGDDVRRIAHRSDVRSMIERTVVRAENIHLGELRLLLLQSQVIEQYAKYEQAHACSGSL